VVAAAECIGARVGTAVGAVVADCSWAMGGTAVLADCIGATAGTAAVVENIGATVGMAVVVDCSWATVDTAEAVAAGSGWAGTGTSTDRVVP
jgi:hypothetical protein